MYERRKREENGEEPYKTFADAVEIAQARAIKRLTEQTLDEETSRGVTFVLERRFCDEHGRRQEIDVSERGAVMEIVERVIEPRIICVDQNGRDVSDESPALTSTVDSESGNATEWTRLLGT